MPKARLNGEAIQVKFDGDEINQLKKIAELISRDTMLPKPTVQSLIRKAVRNYIAEARCHPTVLKGTSERREGTSDRRAEGSFSARRFDMASADGPEASEA